MATVKDSYDRDLYKWTHETGEKIRRGSLSGVEDLGRRDRLEVVRSHVQTSASPVEVDVPV